MLRLPSIAFYILGILVLRRCAHKMGGEAAANALTWLAVLWPFGFHFGRLAAWYAFCFALVALMTLAYLRVLESPGLKNGFFLFCAVLLLVYANYYGWAVFGCLLIDSLLRRHRGTQISLGAFVLFTLGLLLGYLPLWHVFLAELHGSGAIPYSVVARIAYAAFNFYSLFVSESVAPWIWLLSIPSGIAIIAILGLTVRFGSVEVRALLMYSLLLIAAMAALGIIGTKRLLFVSDWALLSISVAMTQIDRRWVRQIIGASLLVVGLTGWFGIIDRSYYSAPHFIEPWQTVAEAAKAEMDAGTTVVSNSPSFFFYLTYLVQCPKHASCPAFGGMLPISLKRPLVYDVTQWPPSANNMRAVLFVKGVNANFVPQTTATEDWLSGYCHLVRQETLLPDSGFVLKKRFFPERGQVPYRIQVSKYSCATS